MINMAAILLYIIKTGCCLALFYVGYKLLLSNETFFHFNRKILVTGIMVCMFLPLINIRTETVGFIQQPMIQIEKIITEEEQINNIAANDETIIMPTSKVGMRNLWVDLLFLIFAIGFLVNLFLLIRSYISLSLLIHNGRKIALGNYTIVLLDKPIIPFNYFRYIILSEKDYANYSNIILTHEMAHRRFHHSLDVVMVELLILSQWFNPFVRLLRKELNKIHEFQADAEVLKTGIDTTKYQLLLLKKAVDSGPYTFANSFNHNKLKIRFIMMSKKKSTGWARLKLLLLLPVAALSVYAFARPDGTRQMEQVIRSESTTITPTNQNYSFEFFEAELNNFIREQGGSPSLSSEEKSNFLTEKTKIFSLFVNSKDEILFNNVICPIEQLSSELTKKLVADYPTGKPVLIYMMADRETSTEAITEILNIAGRSFTELKNSNNRKNQPILLQYGGNPKKYPPKTNSGN